MHAPTGRQYRSEESDSSENEIERLVVNVIPLAYIIQESPRYALAPFLRLVGISTLVSRVEKARKTYLGGQ